MGCCGEGKKVGVTKIASIRERLCSDVIFFAAFYASFGFLILIYVLAVQNGGDYNKIVSGVDPSGNYCGIGNKANQPYAVLPNPFVPNFVICTSDCSTTNQCYNVLDALPITGGRNMVFKYPSKPFMGKICLPDVNWMLDIVKSSGKSSALDSFTAVVQRSVADLMSTLPILGGSAGIALIMSYIMMFLISYLAGCIIYCTIALLLGGGSGLGVLLYIYGTKGLTDSTMTIEQAQGAQYTAYVIWAIVGIIALILFFLRKRIQIAVEVVKESADAIADMKFIVFFPFVPLILCVGYLVLWVFMALSVASVTTKSGTPGSLPDGLLESASGYNLLSYTGCSSLPSAGAGTSHPLYTTYNGNVYTMTQNIQWRNYGLYQFFHMLWVTQFFYYFMYLVFAGATANWYFTARVDNKKKRGSGEGELSHFPVSAAAVRTFICHQGTVAVCALIIAIVQFIRALILYIEKTTAGKPPNKVQKAVFCLISCCLKCIQCCLDKLNKNGLIWTAIFGDGFFVASCSAFMLVWKNLARVAAINVVSGIILAVSKFCVAFMSTAICIGIMFHPYYKNQISSPIFPAVVCFFVSYVTATLFMGVFASVIDAIFLCFLVDSDQNAAGKMFANDSLQKIVGKYESASKEKAKEMKQSSSRRQGAGAQVEPEEPASSTNKRSTTARSN